MCYIHSAALVAEYLRVKDSSSIGCTSFANISPNILPDENIAKDDEGEAGEMRYTEVGCCLQLYFPPSFNNILGQH